MPQIFNFKTVGARYDDLAPDASEIRLLPNFEGAGLCHCTLSAGKISKPVRHKTVNEIWYCLSGKGEIWQMRNGEYEKMEFKTGDSFTIPVGNSFQFRNTGKTDLCILIVTIPKWPGEDEAEKAEGHWDQNQVGNKVKENT
jgi:mannose-6-phosphate isomerase-like protein (cupin superfamily)